MLPFQQKRILPRVRKLGRRMRIGQIIAIGFALIILVGALLLMLPWASRDGQSIPFIDAVFTVSSATCVTGLVVYDTYEQFTLFGQLVILLLIQTGGLGFMAFATVFSFALRKKIGLKSRTLLMESYSTLQLGGVVRLLRRVLWGTLLIEGAGAILLAARFIPVFGFAQGAYFGIFHSISAFCNAGFDLMGALEPYSSLVLFQTDVVVNLTVCALIIIGGIGFVVWDDLCENGLHYKRYHLHTKVVLLSTGALVFGGAALMYVLEGNASMAHLTPLERIPASLFASVTPRTAGFNTVDLAAMSQGGQFLTIFLMMVGASTGSTGGGMKTTTVVLVVMGIVSYIRHQPEINLFGRRIGGDMMRRAYSAATMFVGTMILATFALLCIQPLEIVPAFYEVTSALGTVGLTLGITRDLLPISRLIVAFLMYCGRVGSLSVVMAVAERPPVDLQKPEGKLLVG